MTTIFKNRSIPWMLNKEQAAGRQLTSMLAGLHTYHGDIVVVLTQLLCRPSHLASSPRRCVIYAIKETSKCLSALHMQRQNKTANVEYEHEHERTRPAPSPSRAAAPHVAVYICSTQAERGQSARHIAKFHRPVCVRVGGLAYTYLLYIIIYARADDT
jgi:hypothetical protein